VVLFPIIEVASGFSHGKLALTYCPQWLIFGGTLSILWAAIWLIGVIGAAVRGSRVLKTSTSSSTAFDRLWRAAARQRAASLNASRVDLLINKSGMSAFRWIDQQHVDSATLKFPHCPDAINHGKFPQFVGAIAPDEWCRMIPNTCRDRARSVSCAVDDQNVVIISSLSA